MIDTVALTLKQHMFAILEHDEFAPSASLVYKPGKRQFIRCYRNPTSKELKQGKYIPRLTLTGRPINTTLRVELSVPKFLYGNNFDEVTEKDFSTLIEKLRHTLEQIGVNVYSGYLEKANVSLIHYGKNIVLTDYTTPATYINELCKADIPKMYDFNKTDYRNGGQIIKFRANTFEFAIYDKVADLRRAKTSDKRSEEKDSAIQLSLLNKFNSKSNRENKPFEVVRLEARLNNRRKIRQILKKIGQNQVELTFQSLFNKTIARKVVLYYLNYILDNQIHLCNNELTATRYFTKLNTLYPELSLSKKTQIVGARTLIKEIGVRKFRELTKVNGNTAWYRLKKILKELKLPRNKGDPIGRLVQEVKKFEPTKLSDHPLFSN